MRLVLRYPELAEFVIDPEQRQTVRPSARFREEIAERLGAAGSHERRLSVLRRYKHREFVRVAARHVLAPVVSEVETAEWSALAEALLVAALDVAVARAREEGRWTREDAGDLAILALGRFGGRELHFGSDLDLLYVHGSTTDATQQQYEALAKAFGEVVQTVTEEGRLFELDLRLRPEGRQGFGVASLEAARRYYGEGGRGQTWELQMLTRLRPVAGDPATAAAFTEVVLPRVYQTPMPEAWTEEIRAMKRRIETERVAERDRETHLKLGPGGLSDIEFLVQYLQLRHGGEAAALREVSTRVAVTALATAGVLTASEAEALLAAHDFLTRLRQTHSLLLTDGSPDALPIRPEDVRRGLALARASGYTDLTELLAEGAARRHPVRELLLRVLGPL
jgi:glutamate-ammonia-ligase adenylyltransferase